jgi:NitT/TauT family transport system ATP-binding protein
MLQTKIEIRDAGLVYGAPGSAPALAGINLNVYHGEFLAILGPSGCGKSTLLKLISGLITPTDGVVVVDGKRVDKVPDKIGFVFQSDALLPWKSARDNVALGAILSGKTTADANRVAEHLLDELGLAAAYAKFPGQLSGGMRKRVALARTLAYNPTAFLLDEPFSALDAQTRIHVGNRFLRVLESLNTCVIIVTHDIDEAIAMADRVIVMSPSPGRVAAEIEIDIPRPRDYYSSRFHPDFPRYQEQIWKILSGEATRS